MRNQDYPIVGPWEKNTLVAFCEPTEKDLHPYMFVSSAGLHTSGLTSMNIHGLTVAAHAHFGKDVSLTGAPIFYLGSEVISRAKTIDEAIEIIKSHKPHANWTLVISSAKENKAVAVELTPKECHVRHMQNGKLAHTNFFHNEKLNKNEALICGGRHDDDFARITRMHEEIEKNREN